MAKVAAARAQAAPDERAGLRGAIADADEAKAALAGHQQAITLAKERIAKTTAALNAARTRTAEGKRRSGEGLALILGSAVGTPPARTQARPPILEAHERVAADAVETARLALAHLEETLPQAEQAVALAENAVLVEIQKLMVPLVERLLAEGEEARRKFIAMRVALQALARDFQPLPKFAQDAGGSLRASATRAEPLGGLRDQAENFGRFGVYHTADEEAEFEFQVTKLWHQAREALRTDPDFAGLPTI